MLACLLDRILDSAFGVEVNENSAIARNLIGLHDQAPSVSLLVFEHGEVDVAKGLRRHLDIERLGVKGDRPC